MSTSEFFDAIRNGNSAVIGEMLDREPELASAKNDTGVSAILMSAYTGRNEIRDLLIARGALMELHDAAAVGDAGRVQELVQSNPSLAKSQSPDGFPVVALASVFGHLDIVRYLVQKGADVNAAASNGSGYNALTGAVASGHTATVKWLLGNGANANYKYGLGYTPLLTAAANGRLEILKLLVEHEADAQAVTNDGKTAVGLATARNHPEILEYLRTVR